MIQYHRGASSSRSSSSSHFVFCVVLIDEGSKVRESWKVPKAAFGLLPGRVTYVIGKDGKVISLFDDLAAAEVHPVNAFEAL